MGSGAEAAKKAAPAANGEGQSELADKRKNPVTIDFIKYLNAKRDAEAAKAKPGDDVVLPHPRRPDRYFVDGNRAGGIPLSHADAQEQALIDLESAALHVVVNLRPGMVQYCLQDTIERVAEWSRCRDRIAAKPATRRVPLPMERAA
jgi:hypothetical protein